MALIAAVLLALAARLVPGARTIDDAYITFRYARNLLAGEGFVYNPGQRVQGTTTPLYTLLLAAEQGILPGAGLPTLALVTNALADAGSVVLLAWLGRRALGAPGLGIAAGLLWALSPVSVTFAIGGMETSVYVLLLLAALAGYAAGRSRWSAFLCALATLTRPDALLLVGPLFAYMVWERAFPMLNHRAERAKPFGLVFYEVKPSTTSDPAPQGLCPFSPESLAPGRSAHQGATRTSKPRSDPTSDPAPQGLCPLSPEPSAPGGCTAALALVRRLPWIEFAIYGLTLAPWLIFATLYFGSPLAHSVVAKSAAYRLEPYSALVRLIQHYATPFLEQETLGTGWVGVGAVLYLFLSLLGGWAMVQRPPAPGRLLPLALYPWLYLLAFALYNPLLFRWYLAPILPMYTLCILYGVDRLLHDLAGAVGQRVPSARGPARRLTSDDGRRTTRGPSARGPVRRVIWDRVVWGVEALLVLAAAGLLLNAWTLHPDHGPDRPAPEMAWFKLELLYRQATLDLVETQPIAPETRIAAGDIGVIGYLSGARILDTVGLVSPEVMGYYPLPDEAYAITYAVSTDLILDQQPDYAILLEVYARNTLQRSPAFARAYALYRRWPADIYGSEGLLVYRRRESGR